MKKAKMRVSLRTLMLMSVSFLLALVLSSVYKTFSIIPLARGWDRLEEDSLSPETSETGHVSASLPVKKLDERGIDSVIPVDESEARRLKEKVRVLVWVMTSPKSADRAHVVKTTWGTRANRDLLLFMSSEKDPSLPSVALQMKEGRDHLTAKTMQAFDYIYNNYFDKADFFMKADDDTYVVMENLRYFLSYLNPKDPFVTGRHFRHHVKQGPDAIHEFPISFHYIKPDDMKLMHFFLYNVRPYGISHKFSTT